MFKYFFIVSVLILTASCESDSNVQTEKQDYEQSTEEQNEGFLFEKLGKESGFYFVNELIENPSSNILNYEYLYNGSGVAIGDVNNDGLPDIFMGGNFFGGRLFLNKGDMKFEQISESAGVYFEGYTTGVCFVDINNDGYDDIYMTRSKSENPEERRNILLVNNKDLTFTDKAAEYGVNDPGYGTNSMFFDYDNDGDLDLYVLNHRSDFKNATVIPINGESLPYEKSDQKYSSDRLYENANGTFKDVTQEAGLLNNRFGLGVFASDINKDGWLDLYVSNDFNDKDHLYINNQNGGFDDEIDNYLDHLTKNSMGCEVGDFNNDGLEDIVTLDMSPEDNYRQKQLSNSTTYDMYHLGLNKGIGHQILRNCLHKRENDGFAEIGQLMGVSHTDWSWTPILADFDNDGNKDLFISNGYYRDVTDLDYVKHGTSSVISSEGGFSSDWQMKVIQNANSVPIVNYLFKNNGTEFMDVSNTTWGKDTTFSNGCVFADLDLDGDLDLICNNFNQPSSIYENKSETNGNNFIGFTSKAHKCDVYVFQGDKKQLVNLNPYRGYMSNHHKVAHFGLGKDTKVDSVIYTINNVTKVIYNPEINQYQNLDETNGKLTSPPDFSTKTEIELNMLISLMSNNDVETEHNDFKYEPLLSRKNSGYGAKICKGDLNKDGRTDLFVTGGAGVSGKILIQNKDGAFSPQSSQVFNHDSKFHDADASLVDVDSDGDLDILVVSGGYQFEVGSDHYKDRIYMNDGKGNFESSTFLAGSYNGRTSLVYDFNHDNKPDVLVFGGATPKNYPDCEESYVLKNYNNALKEQFDLLPNKGKLGIVNDAALISINSREIIVLAREWDYPMALEYNNGQFSDVSKDFGLNQFSGIWNSVDVFDYNDDGEDDLIFGNVGSNDFYRPKLNGEASLVYGDLFNSGMTEAIEFYKFKEGTYHTKNSLDELFEINPVFRKTYPRYSMFSGTVMTEFLENLNAPDYQTKRINTKKTMLLLNQNGSFEETTLPIQAQYSEVHGSMFQDVNKDGQKDLILIGNNFDVNIKQGIKDAGGFQLFLRGKNPASSKYLRLSNKEFSNIIELDNRIIVIDKDYVLWELKR